MEGYRGVSYYALTVTSREQLLGRLVIPTRTFIRIRKEIGACAKKSFKVPTLLTLGGKTLIIRRLLCVGKSV